MNEQYHAHRLLSKANKVGECLICHIGPNSRGYSTVLVHGVRWQAHRLIYWIEKGPIPAGMCILHSCDTRRCINIDHLRIGTELDNFNDMLKRGRRRYAAKERIVTNEMIAIMQSLREDGLTYKQIGAKLGLGKTTAYEYVAGIRHAKG